MVSQPGLSVLETERRAKPSLSRTTKMDPSTNTRSYTSGSYKYLWIMMNDLILDEDKGDPLRELLAQMNSDPNMALLSPTNHGVGSIMPGARPRFFPRVSKQRWRKVAVVDYLGF